MSTITRLVHRTRGRVHAAVTDERGDVPGWVLITLMTAALVAAIWGVASERLVGMFEAAMDSVSNLG